MPRDRVGGLHRDVAQGPHRARERAVVVAGVGDSAAFEEASWCRLRELKALIAAEFGAFTAPKFGAFNAPKFRACTAPELGAFIVTELGACTAPECEATTGTC